MTNTYTLSDIEFFVLWSDITEDPLPDPLEFLARTNDIDEFERSTAEARAALAPILGNALGDLRKTLLRPEITLQVFGRDARSPEDPRHCLRMLGVRCGTRGYLIRQLMGETLWHSTGFVITECDAVRLGTHIAESIPTADPGHRGEILLPTTESDQFDHDYGRSAVYESRPRGTNAAEMFLRTPIGLTGTIEVIQSMSRFGPRGQTSRLLVWRDNLDDGRYAMAIDNEIRAVPVDTKHLAVMIDAAVADVVRAIKDERR